MNKKSKVLIMIVVIVGILSITGITYALWSKTYSQSGENIVASKCFQMVFLEDSGTGINLENSFPMYDSEGKKLKPYTFSITNTCDSAVDYQLNLETTTNSTMKDSYIKVMVNETEPYLLNTGVSVTPTLKDGKSAYVLERGILEGNETKEYSLRIWMDENVTQNDEGAMNNVFESKITITGSFIAKYKEDILNGADPVLDDGLIPVVINDSGVVTKADLSREWYNYSDKIWANAVILEDENISYANGEIIPESNIESYFVWIPRYRYKIFNTGNYTSLTAVENKVQTIEVIFETKEVAASTNSGIGQWLTHPAFTAFDVNGIWVGKFETGYKGAATTAGAEVNANDSGKVQIKPNVYSWRGVQVSNAHLSSYNYKREYDSHMMKNTEWGAVAYLSHSAYGSQESVRMNNNEAFITGYSAVNEPTCGYSATNKECNKYESTALGVDGTYTLNYFNPKSVVSSTTGNYSGVYDMSGRPSEYVMGVILDKSGNPMSGRSSIYNSGFNGTFGCPTCDGNTSGLTSLTTGINFPESKYYDTYGYSESQSVYNRRILGDATGEMGPFATETYGSVIKQIGSWYGDDAYYLSSVWPWFGRGGLNYGTGTGIFSFATAVGSAGVLSFRVVLAI